MEKTGLQFGNTERAALEWSIALADAGGRISFSRSMNLNFINIFGAGIGGLARTGDFSAVGIAIPGILSHELGHSLSLPHWGANPIYPYRGKMHGIPAPSSSTLVHVGPTWAFDLPTMTFLPPTVGPNTPIGTEGRYKASPMQGSGMGDQESPFILRHFSDYGVNQVQNKLEERLLFQRDDDWFIWDQTTGEYSNQVTSELGIRAPIETDVEVISLMVTASISHMDLNMIYTPIGPYEGNLLRNLNPNNEADRVAARQGYCPPNGCNFIIRVTQGSSTNTYMLATSGGTEGGDLFGVASRAVAINLAVSDGEISRVELLLTPDAEINGLPDNPEVLDSNMY